MKYFLMLFLLIISSCKKYKQPDIKYLDDNCRDYIAIAGEPCKYGMYLDVPLKGNQVPICKCSYVVIE